MMMTIMVLNWWWKKRLGSQWKIRGKIEEQFVVEMKEMTHYHEYKMLSLGNTFCICVLDQIMQSCSFWWEFQTIDARFCPPVMACFPKETVAFKLLRCCYFGGGDAILLVRFQFYQIKLGFNPFYFTQIVCWQQSWSIMQFHRWDFCSGKSNCGFKTFHLAETICSSCSIEHHAILSLRGLCFGFQSSQIFV